MGYALFFSILAGFASNAFAQEPPDAVEATSKSSRDAVIKRALARDHGEITATEAAHSDGGGVFIGYSSGAVVRCQSHAGCRALGGTPSSAVTGAVLDISVSHSGGTDIAWVAYPHGVVYRCVDALCREFDHD